MGKKLSGAQKRKKKREKEEAVERARADVERLKLGPDMDGIGGASQGCVCIARASEIERDGSVFL